MAPASILFLIMRAAYRGPLRGAERPSSERRVQTRYAIALDLSYAGLDLHWQDETGTGQTIDISSSALRFRAARPLAVGVRVEVAIDWPPRLHGTIPLQLDSYAFDRKQEYFNKSQAASSS